MKAQRKSTSGLSVQLNQEERPDYSVVIPVYNSAGTLVDLCNQLVVFFEEHGYSFELVFVNDHSADNSWNVLKDLKGKHSDQIRVIDLNSNVGQHRALLCGFHFCKGRHVITIDDDLQVEPAQIQHLITEQKEKGADLVYGIYPEKKHSMVKNAGSWLLERVLSNYASTAGKGSSFKLISGEVIQKLKNHNLSYVYIDEILHWYATQVSFTEVEHKVREIGTSGYSLIKLAVMTLNIILTYTILPLRLIIWFGLISAVVCLCFGIYFIHLKFTTGAELGFTALIVSIFFSTSLILLCLGIIGEYVNRLFVMQSRKPLFSVRESL